MRVLIACEFSGTVRNAFRKLGHEAFSCDILPDENDSIFHYQDDIFHHLTKNFQSYDLMIAHPPCTYLCNSGVRHLYTKDGDINISRWEKMEKAKLFFENLLNYSIPRIAVENPIPHRYGLGKTYDQIIQPWQFGHGETKATCLWLKNLPKLKPTNIVEGREQRIHKLPPSKDRWKLRSITYQGIAEAFASQWGDL